MIRYMDTARNSNKAAIRISVWLLLLSDKWVKLFRKVVTCFPTIIVYINRTVVLPIAVSGIINQSKGNSAYG